MPKAAPIINNFTGGELSPLVIGRVDSDRYKLSTAGCLNVIPTIQGPLIGRPGSYYVATAKSPGFNQLGQPYTGICRLIPFKFSVAQSYILEFGNNYIRFYLNQAQILSGGTPYEISSPYQEGLLAGIKFVQSADTLYLVHPFVPPYKLQRHTNTSWTLTALSLIDGPYLDQNSTTTTMVASGTGPGTVTITASTAAGINNGAGFRFGDVGRILRMFNGTTWSKLMITGFTDSTHCTANVIVANAPTSGVTTWRLGVYETQSSLSWPSSITFHENRLWLGGAPNTPQRVDASNSGDYENFTPTDLTGGVQDNLSFQFTCASSDVNSILWMRSNQKGLMLGTIGNEWLLRASTLGTALGAATNKPNGAQVTGYGSANIQGETIGNATIFVQRSGRKVREMLYTYYLDNFTAPDLTLMAEHITGRGIAQVAFQNEPQPILWAVTIDGDLISMTYERDLDAVKVGWVRHQMGGSLNMGGIVPPNVESIAVIPYIDGNGNTADQLWLVVKRVGSFGVARHIEVLTAPFDSTVEQEDAFMVDAGLTYDNPIPIDSMTIANPGVFSIISFYAGSIFTGDKIKIEGFIFGADPTVTEGIFIAEVLTPSGGFIPFKLKDVNTGAYLDTSACLQAYVTGSGVFRKFITVINGITHLEGQTVSILADGAVQPDQVVNNSAQIILGIPATTVQVGLPYNSDIQLLRFESGAANGTSIGKTRRTNRVGLLLYRALGLKVGFSFDAMDDVVFRTSEDDAGEAVPLYTGILSETYQCDFDFENQVCIRRDQPFPFALLAVMPQLETQDRE